MRLNRHREDVRDLKLIRDDLHIQDIARRYLNLIRCFEQQFNRSGMLTKQDVEDYGGPWLKRVLKDAEGK